MFSQEFLIAHNGARAERKLIRKVKGIHQSAKWASGMETTRFINLIRLYYRLLLFLLCKFS